VSQAEVARAAQPTIDAAWAPVEANRRVLDDLLAQRGAQAATLRSTMAVLLLLGVLGTVYLYAGIWLNIDAGVKEATTAARAMAAGEFGTVRPVSGRDEFADLVTDLARADRSLQ
jgi:methyl-accepting chemotaxis protein